MMRAVPGLTIVDPCDALDISQAVPADRRAPRPGLHAPAARQGAAGAGRIRLPASSSARPRCCATAATCWSISSGLLTMRALEAAKALAADKRGRGVLHVPDHQAAGRGHHPPRVRAQRAAWWWWPRTTAPSAAWARRWPPRCCDAGVAPRFARIGLPDAFLDAGALPTLHDRYGISTDAICARIKGWLA
jgi:transketolase